MIWRRRGSSFKAASGPPPVLNYAQTVIATPGVKYYWNLDPGGTNINDLIDSNECTNMASQPNPGNVRTPIGHEGYDFSNSGLLTGVAQTLAAGAPFSLEAYIRALSGVGGGGGTIFQLNDGSLSLRNTLDMYVSGGGDGMVCFGVGGGVWAISSSVGDNAWHHIVGTYDGTTLKLYVDGVASGSPGITTTPSVASLFWWLGRGQQPLSGGPLGMDSTSFKGSLAEMAVYSVALSADEVAAHHAAAIA